MLRRLFLTLPLFCVSVCLCICVSVCLCVSGVKPSASFASLLSVAVCAAFPDPAPVVRDSPMAPPRRPSMDGIAPPPPLSLPAAAAAPSAADTSAAAATTSAAAASSTSAAAAGSAGEAAVTLQPCRCPDHRPALDHAVKVTVRLPVAVQPPRTLPAPATASRSERAAGGAAAPTVAAVLAAARTLPAVQRLLTAAGVQLGLSLPSSPHMHPHPHPHSLTSAAELLHPSDRVRPGAAAILHVMDGGQQLVLPKQTRDAAPPTSVTSNGRVLLSLFFDVDGVCTDRDGGPAVGGDGGGASTWSSSLASTAEFPVPSGAGVATRAAAAPARDPLQAEARLVAGVSGVVPVWVSTVADAMRSISAVLGAPSPASSAPDTHTRVVVGMHCPARHTHVVAATVSALAALPAARLGALEAVLLFAPGTCGTAAAVCTSLSVPYSLGFPGATAPSVATAASASAVLPRFHAVMAACVYAAIAGRLHHGPSESPMGLELACAAAAALAAQHSDAAIPSGAAPMLYGRALSFVAVAPSPPPAESPTRSLPSTSGDDTQLAAAAILSLYSFHDASPSMSAAATPMPTPTPTPTPTPGAARRGGQGVGAGAGTGTGTGTGVASMSVFTGAAVVSAPIGVSSSVSNMLPPPVRVAQRGCTPAVLLTARGAVASADVNAVGGTASPLPFAMPSPVSSAPSSPPTPCAATAAGRHVDSARQSPPLPPALPPSSDDVVAASCIDRSPFSSSAVATAAANAATFAGVHNGSRAECCLCVSIHRRALPSAANKLTVFSSKEHERYLRVLRPRVAAAGVSFSKEQLKALFSLTPRQLLLAAFKKVGPWPVAALDHVMLGSGAVHRHW